ncbi:MAG: GDP-mannose 4,6-dehydratase, partial [Bdellovibrionales bacterium]|nr:GDP-mannose 4,6-dehydratase [Bdellovibrionales bacterium]
MTSRWETVRQELIEQPRSWLVTGAAGFIGSHLVETLLEHRQQVVGVDNFATGHRKNLELVRARVGEQAWAQFSFIEGDIDSMSTCEAAVQGVHYVLHQAALGSVPRSIKEPVESNRANVTGFLTMLDAARRAG